MIIHNEEKQMLQHTPRHAELPLWAEKTTEQKMDNLKILMNDLKFYARQKEIPLERLPALSKESDCDHLLQEVLTEYRRIVGTDILELIFLLEQVKPYDSTERNHLNAIKEFLLKHPHCINMNCESGHMTGSALVIDPKQKKVLLHKHKKLGIWLQFGGHPDYETAPLDVALREAREESGLMDLRVASLNGTPSVPVDVDLQTIPAKKNQPEHLHLDMRYLLITETPDLVKAAQGESRNFSWLTIEEANTLDPATITQGALRLISKASVYFEQHCATV